MDFFPDVWLNSNSASSTQESLGMPWNRLPPDCRNSVENMGRVTRDSLNLSSNFILRYSVELLPLWILTDPQALCAEGSENTFANFNRASAQNASSKSDFVDIISAILNAESSAKPNQPLGAH